MIDIISLLSGIFDQQSRLNYYKYFHEEAKKLLQEVGIAFVKMNKPEENINVLDKTKTFKVIPEISEVI